MMTLICGLEMSKYSHESSPEPLESGKDSVKITIGSDSEQNGVRYQQRQNRPHGLASLSEHVENYSFQRLVIKSMNTGYLRVFALF